MPRFAVLWHETSASMDRKSHFDLLFEVDSTALTWSVENKFEPHLEIRARSLPAHRLDYFNYEGPVSRDRGIVSRWDRGEYRLIAAECDRFAAAVRGAQLRGLIQLRRKADDDWVLTYEPSVSGMD